ncbi:MAG: aminomethyltransferase family protein [Hydrococcus sp. Prado102]|jgi:aminomethyltransferase|nr:aminomethyltransferase family protein [Hydrococcus sp. Prado102]
MYLKRPSKIALPEPLGKIVAEYRIEPATAIAYQVKAGQYIQIIDVEGAQCSDFLAFAKENYTEELDAATTRTLNGLAMPQAGLLGKYFSQTMQPLLEVIQDTCGRHDSFLLACTARYYEDAGYPGHPSCSNNFNRVLQPYGIAPRSGWAAINFFFNTEVNCAGEIVAGESWSRPGDYVLLQAKRDLLCASSACPDDIDPANGWNPSAIHVRIYDANQSFEKAIGRRASKDSPVRLTTPSGFTSSIQKLTDDLTEYNGFWVPNSFAHRGIHDEYWALRERAAIMDLSALRKFEITGEDALDLLQMAFSRDVSKLALSQSAYGCLLNPHGGIIDDGIVFRLKETDYRYVGNCDSDEAWLNRVARQFGYRVIITPSSDRLHNLAIQGPRSREILRSIVELDAGIIDDLAYFRFATGTVAGIPTLISRTGYTGELGYELFVHPQYGAELWDALMEAGKPYDLLPMGMLALDRARIEAGLLGAGREFDDMTSPYQAGIGWAVAMKKTDFIGKSALEKIREHPPKVAVGLVLEGNEVAVFGQCIHAIGENWRVGTITSATFSPILNQSIAIAQVVPEYAAMGTELEVGFVDGMKRRVRATVGTLAAYDPTKSRVRT